MCTVFPDPRRICEFLFARTRNQNRYRELIFILTPPAINCTNQFPLFWCCENPPRKILTFDSTQKFCTVSHVAWHSLDCGPQNESPSFHRLEDLDFRFSNWLNGFHDHINSEVRSHRTRLFCLFNSCIASVQIYRMETTTFTHIASDRIFNLERKRENWCAITAIDR